MKINTALALVLFAAVNGQLRAESAADRFLDAIEHVESGHQANPKGSNDGGKARGWMQIHRGFYADARPGVVAEYGTCPEYEVATASREWSHRLALAWFRRYAKDQLERGDWRTLAARYNGGPRGERNAQARAYAEKVVRVMESSR
jgi:hypothetical protein